jgi:hypothetical protein
MEARGMKTRNEQRQKKLARALIRFDGGRGEAECILRDVSLDGARLLVANTFGIPSEFRLFVGDEPERACFVRWRKTRQLGVQFLSPALASLAS